MFYPDKPIQSCKEDVLGRRGFAEALGDALISFKADDCLAIGLYGQWGSGKTSIINCAIDHIERQNDREDVQAKTIVVKFNPWNFSDQNQLISQFFRCLSSALESPQYGAALTRASGYLSMLSNFFAACALVAGDASMAAAATVTRYSGAVVEGLTKLLSKDLGEIKRNLVAELSQQPNKIVVVIDDIDRLNSLEVRQVFQLVKALADFPRTIYVLAFDKEVVLKTLAKAQEGSPEDYLAKIVPVTFDVPLLDRDDLKALLEARLNAILEPDWPRKEWAGTYSWFMYGFFRNMRDVNRYANTLHFSYGILKNDVNLRDLMLITAIQVRAPVLYDAIRANRWLLAGVYRPSFLAHGFPEKEKLEKEGVRIEFEQLLEKSEGVASEYVRELIRQLFPKYEEIVDSKSHGDWDLREWALGRRICHPTFFDRYFRLSIPKGQLWQRDLDEIFTLADEEEPLSERLKALHQTGELGDLLRTLEHYDPKLITESRKKNIIKVLLKTGDSLCDSGKRPLGRVSEIMGVIDPLIRSFSDLDERFEILNEAVTGSSDSPYCLVELIHYIDEIHKKLHRTDVDTMLEKYKPEVLIVRGAHLDSLKALVSDKIFRWGESGHWAQHSHFGEVIRGWMRWGSGDNIRQMVEKMTVTREAFLTFCGASLLAWMGDEPVPSRTQLVVKSVSDFFPLHQVERRMLDIKNSPDFDALDEQHKAVVRGVLEAITVTNKTTDGGLDTDRGEQDSDS